MFGYCVDCSIMEVVDRIIGMYSINRLNIIIDRIDVDKVCLVSQIATLTT